MKKSIHGNGAHALTPNLHNTPLIQKVTVPDTRAETILFNLYLQEKALKEEAYDVIHRMQQRNAQFKQSRKAYSKIKSLIGGQIPTGPLDPKEAK
jgi:hypothetical protein